MTTNAHDIQSAKRTIDKEIEALRMMEDQLDDSLCKALDVMQKTTGRVIITGMGKSGHIGSKIAATLASTGTPSFFVHPGEASHGDLGMLTASDFRRRNFEQRRNQRTFRHYHLLQKIRHSFNCNNQKS